MESHDWIFHDVAQIEHSAFAHHLWMLVHHEPANVGKEEATIRIMWIGISLWEFMVHTMITNPFVDWILPGYGKAQH